MIEPGRLLDCPEGGRDTICQRWDRPTPLLPEAGSKLAERVVVRMLDRSAPDGKPARSRVTTSLATREARPCNRISASNT